jgi:hypothetical protein
MISKKLTSKNRLPNHFFREELCALKIAQTAFVEGGEEAGGDAQARSQKAKAKAVSARAHDRPTGGRGRGSTNKQGQLAAAPAAPARNGRHDTVPLLRRAKGAVIEHMAPGAPAACAVLS